MKTHMKLVRPLTIAAVILLLLLMSHLSFSQSGTKVRNVVIVHGAFVDASGGEAVYRILKKDGYNVTLVQNRGGMVITPMRLSLLRTRA